MANLDWFTGALAEAGDRVRAILAGWSGVVTSTESWARAILSNILRDQGDYAAARAERTKALALAESQHNVRGTIANHLGLAAIETADGSIAAAAAHIDTAETLKPDAAHIWDCDLLIARADLALARGDDGEALEFAEAAATLDQASHIAGVRGITNHRYLGDGQLAVGGAEDALASYQQMIARADAANFACRLAEGHEGCAAASCALGNNDAAHEHLTTATKIREHTRSRRVPRRAVDRYLITLEAERASARTVRLQRPMG